MIKKDIPVEGLPDSITLDLPLQWIKATASLEEIDTVEALASVLENLRQNCDFKDSQELLLDVIESFLVAFEEKIGFHDD